MEDANMQIKVEDRGEKFGAEEMWRNLGVEELKLTDPRFYLLEIHFPLSTVANGGSVTDEASD